MTPSAELLQQEVTELTDLLRHDGSFEDIRDVLDAHGLSASDTVLAGLIEGEDESQYGVLLTPARECIRFEVAPDGSTAIWETVGDPGSLANDFQAVSAGLDMMRNGQIS